MSPDLIGYMNKARPTSYVDKRWMVVKKLSVLTHYINNKLGNCYV